MPFIFNKETKDWDLADLTPEEINALLKAGKEAIIAGKAVPLTKDSMKTYLEKLPKEKMWNS